MNQGDAPKGDEPAPVLTEEQIAARNERRKAQDVLWSGSKIDGRVHWSVRECYRLYTRQLKAALRNYYGLAEVVRGLRQPGLPLSTLSVQEAALVAEAAFHGHGKLLQALAERPATRQPPRRDAPFRVCVRKRPLLDFELEAGEFDSVGVRPALGEAVCHDGRLHRTGRRITMTHHHFSVDGAWDAGATNDDVYRVVAPLVARAARGLSSTVVCYGQTGTGKTHTMVGLLERAARDLAGLAVEAVFFEIHGKKCYDLLRHRREVHLRADAAEAVHVRGARREVLDPVDPEGLLEVLREALALRQVEVTERNPVSSRSHAVCELRVLRTAGGGGREKEGHQEEEEEGGVLRFVDLAGSERNYETHAMTAQQHRDSADINTALMALKNCFRAYGANTRASFRASRLTQVLRSCFTDEDHRTIVLATVSPSPTDLIHTVNTLTHVSYMAPELSGLSRQVAVDLPIVDLGASSAPTRPIQSWTHEEVCAWVGAAEGGRFAHLALPPGLDGAGLMKLGTMRLSQLFDGSLREARGDNEGSAWTQGLGAEGGEEGEGSHREARDAIGRALFAALRRESRRIAEAEGQRRMGVAGRAQQTSGSSADHLSATGPVRVRTLGGNQVQWWLDTDSDEAAAEAAEQASRLLMQPDPTQAADGGGGGGEDQGQQQQA